MNRILEDKQYDFINQTLSLPTELQKLVDSGFRTEQGCIFFKDFKYFGPNALDSDYKKTEYEDFLNHIHIDDHITYTEDKDEFEYLKVGLEFSKSVYRELKSAYQSNFRITVSFSETKFDKEDIDTFGGCVVRFYMIRQSCDDKFKIESLDEFKNEAVLEIE